VKGEPKPGRQKYGFFNYLRFFFNTRATTSLPTTKKTAHQKCKNVNASSRKRASDENHQRISSEQRGAQSTLIQ
jgi:hypothetical protein